MARVRLLRHEVEDLPRVCMRCGARAATERRRNFGWAPPWVHATIFLGLLPYIIIALALTKRRTVYVPLCYEHRNHWLWRNLVISLSFVALGVLGIGSVILMSILEEQSGRRGGGPGGLVCCTGICFLLAWIVLTVVLQMNAIRPTEITDRTITLTGVSEEFLDAVEQQDEEDEGGYRPRKRPPPRDRDAFYDRDEPRRRRAPRRYHDEE